MSAQLQKPVAYPAFNPVIMAVVLGLLFAWGMLASTRFYNGSASPDDWGMLTVNYMFLLGLSQWGIAFSAIMRMLARHFFSSIRRVGLIIIFPRLVFFHK